MYYLHINAVKSATLGLKNMVGRICIKDRR